MVVTRIYSDVAVPSFTAYDALNMITDMILWSCISRYLYIVSNAIKIFFYIISWQGCRLQTFIKDYTDTKGHPRASEGIILDVMMPNVSSYKFQWTWFHIKLFNKLELTNEKMTDNGEYMYILKYCCWTRHRINIKGQNWPTLIYVTSFDSTHKCLRNIAVLAVICFLDLILCSIARLIIGTVGTPGITL